jgi:malate dehydrogenase (quinone)
MKKVDVLLVGAGVMSATLGRLLLLLDPSLKIVMVERLDRAAGESSDALNNAGTGHAGYCELNYTKERKDGSIDIGRALAINSAYEVSLQFWSYLVENGMLPSPEKFINPVCHQSLVWGGRNLAYLKKRFDALRGHHLFEQMEYSEDRSVLEQWMPLAMQNRDSAQKVAATQVKHGTDVDFGSLTRALVESMKGSSDFELMLSHEVKDLVRLPGGRWQVRLDQGLAMDAGFVFLGAGGGSLPLLQKSGIPESRGYGGFPVSGQWLICKNPDVVKRHASKVYGKAPSGAPPMSVPHLDARLIDGRRALLFGPFAGMTTRFLKEGSALDLFMSMRPGNIRPMLSVARDNLDLMRYLVTEAFKSHKDRVESLKEFYADAAEDDWELSSAGQRVQVIKACSAGGRLEFGTEIVAAGDGSLAALLGASPGASVSVQAMLEIVEKCFSSRAGSTSWQVRLKEMIPSYGMSLIENRELLAKVRSRNLSILGLASR